MSIADCHLIDLPKVTDPRGNLTFIEGGHHVPFDIKRIFYLYDIPGGADRGGHSLIGCHQFLIAVTGGFDVVLDDGEAKKRIHLNRSYHGLHLPPMVWREMDNFSTGAVCLVLASEYYSEDDYIRHHDRYLELARAAKKTDG